MGTAQGVVVSFVNPPKPGKTNGSIKTRDGAIYGVPQAMLAKFSQNMICDITYDEREWQGQTYKTINDMIPKGTAPRFGGGARGNTYRETSKTDAERMFCCSILNAGIAAGKVDFNEAELGGAIECLRNVWRDTFGKDKPTPPPTGPQQ